MTEEKEKTTCDCGEEMPGENCGCEDCEGAPITEKPACGCCGRKKARTEQERTAIINRLRRVEGQSRGIEKMVRNDVYCPDIITQISAALAGLGAVSRELLTAHIRTCVATDLSAGKTETAEELARLIERLMK